MKIPSDAVARGNFFEDILQQCLLTRDERKTFYNEMRRYYMHGCAWDGDPGTAVNKIYPHIDQLTSFMYAQETTKFAVTIPPSVSDAELDKVPSVNEALNNEWHDSNTDIIFGTALTWSFVYGSMFLKTRWNGRQTETSVVEPHNFGVIREDVPMLDRQEAFVHCYLTTQSELERELTIAKHPRLNDILSHVVPNGALDTTKDLQVGNIVISSVSPMIVGNWDVNLMQLTRYQPKVLTPLIQMYELYIYDNEAKDYIIVTMADPSIVIYDRPIEKMLIKNEHPFTQVAPNPTPDYFWGYSEVERLIPLQTMRNKRLNQVRKMMDRQAQPPKSFSGFDAVSDEIANAFDTPDGVVISDNPQAKVDPYQPTIPEDLFAEIREMDTMFEETSGINNVLSGRGEKGVRSEGHANQLAKLGSSRAKKRALIVEDSLERLASLDLKLMQKYSATKYKGDDGLPFVLDQFTKDFNVKVDAHSNSPIFMDEVEQKAFELFKAKAIDREELIDLIDIPMKQLLKKKLKTKIEPAEAKAAQDEKILQLKHQQGKKA